MATCELAGGTQMATRDLSPNRAARIGRGKCVGPRPGAGDTDAAAAQERADESVKHCAARLSQAAFEPQPRGAVTRRAVAQRRSRASGLTRPSAAAIRGFDWGFWLGFVVGPLARSAAVWCKSFVFASYPQTRRSYYLFFNYLFFNYLFFNYLFFNYLYGEGFYSKHRGGE